MSQPLRMGLLVNPVAGLGGETALAGSDGAAVQALARARGGESRGQARAERLLLECQRLLEEAGRPLRSLVWKTWAGGMGEAAFRAGDWTPEILGAPAEPSQPADTVAAVQAIATHGVDLLLFVGGDGTARDVVAAVPAEQLCLGVPAGVKMHSGVFATTPEAAAQIVVGLSAGAFVASAEGEVIDLDEAARRAGDLRTRRYGTLRVPVAGGYVQRTKEAGRENEGLAVEEIVAEVVENATGQLVLGPGSTCQRIKEALGLEPTLLGFDVWNDGQQQGSNVDARWLSRFAPAPERLIIGFIRRQGFLFGRGNQQLSASWLAGLQKTQLQIVATRTKLGSLEGAPLLVDTDDPDLSKRLSGVYPITVGYQDTLLYRVSG